MTMHKRVRTLPNITSPSEPQTLQLVSLKISQLIESEKEHHKTKICTITIARLARDICTP